MDVSQHFTGLLAEFAAAKVRYLVVGAHAVAYHTEPRYTKDFDVWVDPTPENAERVWKALVRFGAPLTGVKPADFTDPHIVFYMGVAPYRIDVLTGIDGATFPVAWRNRVRTSLGGVAANVLGKRDLIRAKRAAGRPIDLIDAARLAESNKLRKGTRRRRRR